MGNNLTTIVPSQILPIETYLRDYHTSIRSLGTTRFLKAACVKSRASNSNYNRNNELSVVKVFVIPEELLKNNTVASKNFIKGLKIYKNYLNKLKDSLNLYTTPNLLPYNEIRVNLGDSQDLYADLHDGQFFSSGAQKNFGLDDQDNNFKNSNSNITGKNIISAIYNLQHVNLIRPYKSQTLYDLVSEQNMSYIITIWIIYQILKVLEQLQLAKINHLDIKLENFILSQDYWLQLTDFGIFKPELLPMTDPSIFNFYFDSSRRRACNIAPERFVEDQKLKSDQAGNKILSDLKMVDTFSAGCCIYELLTGKPLFTLAEILNYKNSQNKEIPNFKTKFASIENQQLKDLIKSMTSLNPSHRLPACEYLSNYQEVLFPNIFYSDLYPVYSEKLIHC